MLNKFVTIVPLHTDVDLGGGAGTPPINFVNYKSNCIRNM